MALSESEKAMLKKLQAKEQEPDAPPVSRSIRATIDLSDAKQIALAIKHGFLSADEVEELKGDDDGKKPEGDDTPRRKGYFGDS